MDSVYIVVEVQEDGNVRVLRSMDGFAAFTDIEEAGKMLEAARECGLYDSSSLFVQPLPLYGEVA